MCAGAGKIPAQPGAAVPPPGGPMASPTQPPGVQPPPPPGAPQVPTPQQPQVNQAPHPQAPLPGDAPGNPTPVAKAGNPQALRDYYNEGAGGQISWGSHGDFDDCVNVADNYMDGDQAAGFCNERHQDATGGAPGTEGKVQKIIRKRPDGYHIMSHDGSKHLGGPYSKAKAKKRLAQIEYFKQKAATATFFKGDVAGHEFHGNQWGGAVGRVLGTTADHVNMKTGWLNQHIVVSPKKGEDIQHILSAKAKLEHEGLRVHARNDGSLVVQRPASPSLRDALAGKQPNMMHQYGTLGASLMRAEDEAEVQKVFFSEDATGKNPLVGGLSKGDVAGHEFHGNRFTGGLGGNEDIASGKISALERNNAIKTLAKSGISMDVNGRSPEIQARLSGFMDRAPGPVQEGGKTWYHDAAQISAERIMPMGFSRDQALAMVANCSPRCSWDEKDAQGNTVQRNLETASMVARLTADNPDVEITPKMAEWLGRVPAYKGGGVKIDAGTYKFNDLPRNAAAKVVLVQPVTTGLPLQIGKAVAVARGEDIDKTTSGVKVRNFYTNLSNQSNASATTMDTWAARVAVGDKIGDKELANLLSTRGGYTVLAEQYKLAASDRGMAPHQVQAITWLQARNEAGAAHEGSGRAGSAATDAHGNVMKMLKLDPLSNPDPSGNAMSDVTDAEWESIKASNDEFARLARDAVKWKSDKAFYPTHTKRDMYKGDSPGHPFRGNQWSGGGGRSDVPVGLRPGVGTRALSAKEQAKVNAGIELSKKILDANPKPQASERALAAAKEIVERQAGLKDGFLRDMRGAVASAGGRLEGEDFAAKTVGSMARKIDTQATDKFGGNYDKAAANIKDGLRTTMIFDHANLATGIKTAMSNLEAQGYTKIGELDNSWHAGSTYKDVSVNLRSPQGEVVEVQFHTPDSIDVKEAQHGMYEAWRINSGPAQPTASEKAQLDNAMRINTSRLPDDKLPPGISGVGTMKWKGQGDAPAGFGK